MLCKKNTFLIFAYIILLSASYLVRNLDVHAQLSPGETVIACQIQATGCTFVGSGSIQKAINQAQASAGNLVEVREGAYSENLTIGAPTLYVRGAGKGKTVINGSMSIAGDNTSNYQIEKLTLQNSMTNGVRIMGSSSIQLNKLEVLNHAGNGIDIGGSGAVVIKGALIAGNTKGIRVASTKVFDVTNSIIAGNRAEGLEQQGESMLAFGLIHSVIYNNGTDGVKVGADFYNTRFVIRNSIIQGNKGYGVSSINEPDPDVAELYMSFNKNIFFENTSGCSNQAIICETEGTLQNTDPTFTDAPVFNMKLDVGSPAIDSGWDVDPDGSVADRGVYGGIFACEYDRSLPYCPAEPIPADTCPRKAEGDADCDGLIDVRDFEIWRSEFKNTGSGLMADFNDDKSINTSDMEIWRSSFLSR